MYLRALLTAVLVLCCPQSQTLKKDGFSFVGPTTVLSFMQGRAEQFVSDVFNDSCRHGVLRMRIHWFMATCCSCRLCESPQAGMLCIQRMQHRIWQTAIDVEVARLNRNHACIDFSKRCCCPGMLAHRRSYLPCAFFCSVCVDNTSFRLQCTIHLFDNSVHCIRSLFTAANNDVAEPPLFENAFPMFVFVECPLCVQFDNSEKLSVLF